jgi:SulP family sulfate permease
MVARALSQLWMYRPSKESIFPFFLWFHLVNKSSLRADLIAGLTGAVIVLPQGVAFAIIAGLPPQYGLYTAMVTPIVAALFGSSRHLISGPTTAISIVIFSTVSRYAEVGTPEFVQMALTVTFLAGVYQLAFGLARLGVLVNFVSHTVVVGFTAGAAILIATSQMKNVMGVHIPKGESFLLTWHDLYLNLNQVQVSILATALATLIIAILIKRIKPKLPNLLIALLAGGVMAQFLGGEGAGIAMVSAIPAQLPPLSMPDISFASVKLLAPNAFAVALLGLIEAVSISRSIAAKSHQRIDGNQEFIGQGLSNIAGSFFSSYAGSGSFTRSGVNYTAGAITPLSAIFSAVILMAMVMLLAPLAVYLPISAMAGVILLVAYNLVDLKQIVHVIRSSKSETAILLTTLASTLFLELEFAIYLGVLLSLVIFLGRTSYPEIVSLAPAYDPVYKKKHLVDTSTRPLSECPNLKIIRFDMSIYFGSLNHLQRELQRITAKEGIVDILIVCSGVNFIDLSGAEMLHHEAERLEELGGGLYFSDLKPKVYEKLSRMHFIRDLGNAHFFDEKADAIRTLQRRLRRQGKCENCKSRVFEECQTAIAAQ